jgi:hypothetical protein
MSTIQPSLWLRAIRPMAHAPAISTVGRACAVAAIFAILSTAVYAQQTSDLVTPPGNILLPNYNSVPIGPNAGLEGPAYIARVADPSAVWLNPAGLSRAETAQISGSSGLFQLAKVSPSTLPNPGGSIQRLPSLVGVIVKNQFGGNWTFGIGVLTANSWNQETNSQLVVDHPATTERFSYSADAQFLQVGGVVSAGYVRGPWRYGAGIALFQAHVERNGVISDRVAGATDIGQVLASSRAEGSALQVRPLFGVQYDLSEHILLGGMIRTPSWTLHRSGSLTTEGVAGNGSTTLGASFFDPKAGFAFKQPFEFHVGAAYVQPRYEVEVVLDAYTPISSYTLLASGQPIVTYALSGPGAVPVIGTRPFAGLISESRGIANVSIGGHVGLTSDNVWRIHFGTGTNLSPVGSADQVFTMVDLYSFTIGVSGTKGRFQFAAGFDYTWGSSNNVIARNLQDGEFVQSGVDLHTIGIIYSVAYKF